MKKTLFLAMFGLAAAALHAEVAPTTEPTVVVDPWNGIGVFFAGDNVISEATDATKNKIENGVNHSAGVDVGSCLGEGSLTLTNGVSLSTPGNLFIGGVGVWDEGKNREYPHPEWWSGTTYNSGKVVVEDGAVLTVATKNTLSAGAGLGIANTAGDVTGELIIKSGGVVHANVITNIGGGKGTGIVEVSGKGSQLDFDKRVVTDDVAIGVSVASGSGSTGIIKVTDKGVIQATDASAAVALKLGEGGNAKMIIDDGGKVSLLSSKYENQALLGNSDGSTVDVELTNKGAFSVNTLVVGKASYTDNTISVSSGSTVKASKCAYFGYAANSNNTLIVNGTGSAFETAQLVTGFAQNAVTMISIENGATVSTSQCWLGNKGGSVTYAAVGAGSSLSSTGPMYVGASGYAMLENAGTVEAGSLSIYAGSEMVNTGKIKLSGNLLVTNNCLLQTGVMEVGNRSQGAEGDAVYSFNSGLEFTGGGSVQIGTYNVRLGTLLVGQGSDVQIIGQAEKAQIRENLLAGLGLKDAACIVMENAIGKNIAYALTTDNFNGMGSSETVAVSGGQIDIERGDYAFIDATGTIGSFVDNQTETTAKIRVDENQTGSAINWHGSELKTKDTYKDTVLGAGTTVNLCESDSKLVVVQDTKLENSGVVNGAVEVQANGELNNKGTIAGDVEVNGTMKGTGTVEGAVTVKKGGALIIGNSPGVAQLDSLDLDGDLVLSISDVAGAAVTGNEGWTGNGYSQLQLDGALTIGDDAKFIIQLGGNLFQDGLMSREIDLDLAIITGITDLTYTGNTGVDVLALLADEDHTKFILSTVNEPGSITADPAYVGFTTSDIHYELKDGTLYLKGKLTVPEPATATLSLLALAGLAARRRRRA